jgi:hypothetical protein
MRTAGLLALAILFPVFVHATVVINELMYKPNPNSGHEWIEIKNTGSQVVDFTYTTSKHWKLNDGGVKPFSGGNSLPAGSIAVLAIDPNTFLADWPGWSGILFDVTSLTSLNDTEATLNLIDMSGAIEDTVSYTNTMGAAGDGNSLQLASGAWIVAAPTPGAANADVPSDTSDTTDTPTTDPSTQEQTVSSSSGDTTTYKPPPSALTLDAGANQNAVMEVPLHFSARATIKGGAVDPSVHISWGFGDGSSAEGDAVEKIYPYAGTYLVVVTATDGLATGRDEFIVTVRPVHVRVLGIPGTGIMIANDASERLDLSGWLLSADARSFHIPSGTVILPKASVLFPSTITNLSTTFDVALAYPDSTVVARYPLPISVVPVVTAPAGDMVVSNAQPFTPQTSFNVVQTVEPIINTEANIQAYEKAVLAPAATTELAAAGAALLPVSSTSAQKTAPATNTRASGLFHSPWTFGLLGVIVAAGGAFILL